MQLDTISFEFGMGFFLYDHDEVSGYPAPWCGIAFTAQRKLHAFHHPGWDTNTDDFFPLYDTVARAGMTFFCNYLTLTSTMWTGTGRLHLSQEGGCDTRDLSGATAGTAGLFG